ncbi:hypothetical protein TNCV_1655841 [Trichonephila clavipes]|nr:hypothetical protein TNCV_1655841 [Trichonephila clavipes]
MSTFIKLLAPLSSKQQIFLLLLPHHPQPKRNSYPPSLQKHLQHRILSHQLPCLSKTKGKIKEQPSPLHRPRKYSKKIDLMSIKPTTNLKKNPEKNTSLKIAREQDFPNETSPVSKKSRRLKTFKTSDAMDTDANPFDSDYVIGLASEEDESLLEADFKKVADNPLKGPLSQSSPKK